MENILFNEDKIKIEESVTYYPMGSYQIGKISRLSALLYERGY